MYNRYIRNDNGSYTRLREEEPTAGDARQAPPPEPPPDPPPRQGEGHGPEGFNGILRHLLDQLHLDSIDTGDLLLLGLLFFLSREDADEELLMALGLLLIL